MVGSIFVEQFQFLCFLKKIVSCVQESLKEGRHEIQFGGENE
jgi:hypothetical protein